jgi:molecular chaperone IbpA
MRHMIDMTALERSAIGFERMLDMLQQSREAETESYPPYTIEKLDDDHYRIALAVAGFNESELDVTAEPNLLTVSGTRKETDEATALLYRGISGRSFHRQFNLADYVVAKDASLKNGLLTIDLARELPESMKPRRIAIGPASGQRARAVA